MNKLAADEASAPSAVSVSTPVTSTGSPGWVPIRSLTARHRKRILAHLVTLPERDRYLRFGYFATDEQLARYVAHIDFQHDEVFGIFDRGLVLIAMAHLAYPAIVAAASDPAAAPTGTAPAAPGAESTMAEFGVSVLAGARGRGLGRCLFEHAVLHARNRGVDSLFIHALSENTVMLKIARRAGALVERHGSESEAHLKLPPDTLSSHVGEMVEQQVAEIDYRLKRQAHLVSGLFGLFHPRGKPASPDTTPVADE